MSRNENLWLRTILVLTAIALMSSGALGQDESYDAFWPKVLTTQRGDITIFQPQVETFAENRLESRSAVSIWLAEDERMIFGAMWFESRLTTDLETRLASLEEVKVTATRFANLDQEKIDKLSRFLEEEIPTWDLTYSLDGLIASLPSYQPRQEQFGSEPPRIHYRTVPTVLVLIDGDPILTGMDGFDLEIVVNSAFFIVKDRRRGYFLRGSGMWFVSDDIAGPWIRTDDLPTEVAKVSSRVEQDEADQAAENRMDAEFFGMEPNPEEPDPEIIVSTVPAELITTAGAADYAAVEGTQLLYLTNTESDILLNIDSQQFYVLLSGRWFRAPDLTSDQWEFVPFKELPPEFSQIPEGSDMATVRPSVPGTLESREAILETQIPQTAEVDRATATVEVLYDGNPEFESCADGVAYARNTDKAVLRIKDKYYCVDSGVWFISATPTDNWEVATEVPPEVQDLPPSCPVYNVKYVFIYKTTPEVVYVGYTPGYSGSFVWGPCVVWGTGWHHPPWWRVHFYPRPPTFGWSVHYSPWTGWGMSFGISHGWLRIGVGWGRPPTMWWGPSGFHHGHRHGFWHGFNHGHRQGFRQGFAAGYRAGQRAGRSQPNRNLYRNRRDGVRRTGAIGRDDQRRPGMREGGRNDVFADRDGNVSRDHDGSWERRGDGRWSEDRPQVRDGERNGNQVNRDQQRDRNPDQQNRSQQLDRSQQNRQMLERDRNNRARGMDRKRQVPNRGGANRGGASRPGGGARRR